MAILGTLATVVNGPWGMAIHDTGNGSSGTANVFVSNVLSGVVSRIDIIYNPGSLSATVTICARQRVQPSGLIRRRWCWDHPALPRHTTRRTIRSTSPPPPTTPFIRSPRQRRKPRRARRSPGQRFCFQDFTHPARPSRPCDSAQRSLRRCQQRRFERRIQKSAKRTFGDRIYGGRASFWRKCPSIPTTVARSRSRDVNNMGWGTISIGCGGRQCELPEDLDHCRSVKLSFTCWPCEAPAPSTAGAVFYWCAAMRHMSRADGSCVEWNRTRIGFEGRATFPQQCCGLSRAAQTFQTLSISVLRFGDLPGWESERFLRNE